MAMIRVEPVEVRVRADWFDGRPREVTLHGRRLRVLEILGVRDESSAFPVVTGPRTLFEVETADARLQLAFRHRSRRWTVEGMETAAAALATPSPVEPHTSTCARGRQLTRPGAAAIDASPVPLAPAAPDRAPASPGDRARCRIVRAGTARVPRPHNLGRASTPDPFRDLTLARVRGATRVARARTRRRQRVRGRRRRWGRRSWRWSRR